MDTGKTDRDAVLTVVYRELISTDLALSSAQTALLALGWTTAGNELGDALATVRDLLHDLGAYAGSTGGES